MVSIAVELCTMYEPGELAPPQFETEMEIKASFISTPRFKDRITFDNKNYTVWDVVYDINENPDNPLSVKAVRKVTYPPTSEWNKDGRRERPDG
jgi:hypothetical protein